MNPSVASLLYACGIAGLFYLDRDKSVRTSKALWLPILYLGVLGSKPVSVWLGITPPGAASTLVDGSPVDAAFFAILLIAGLCVVVHRGRQTVTFLGANGPILIYFLFCLFSIVWSDFPGVALKKSVKAIEDVMMILIVVTDKEPVTALRRLFSRIGFIFVPISLLLIKYYPYLGRAYDGWTGAQMNNGATLNKNTLGVMTFILTLGAVWRVLALLRSDEMLDRQRHLLAQGTLLALGIYLLTFANSATSTVCFAIGAGLMLTTSLRFMKRRPAAVHVLVLFLLVTSAAVMLLGGSGSMFHALGRNSTLTGRTAIWTAVIPMTSNPLVGAGFESFWLNPDVHQRLAELMPGLPLNEAHNGYIETYLNLGWVGLGLIGLIFVNGYFRAVKAFRREPVLGSLLVAYILTEMVYNITEAGFRMLHPMWIFFLLAVIEASRIAAGVGVRASPLPEASPDRRVPELPARNALAMRPVARKMERRQTA
jgi:exopolysaccharide production protein ExoQ